MLSKNESKNNKKINSKKEKITKTSKTGNLRKTNIMKKYNDDFFQNKSIHNESNFNFSDNFNINDSYFENEMYDYNMMQKEKNKDLKKDKKQENYDESEKYNNKNNLDDNGEKITNNNTNTEQNQIKKQTKISADNGKILKKKKINGRLKTKIFATHKWWVDALIFIGGTMLFGGLATLLGGKMFNFQNYKMPPMTAPKIVFPFAWGIIYIAIGVSTFLMWRDKEIKEKDRKTNLILYFVHIFFNVLWPLFFFRLNMPIFAVCWIVPMIGLACACMYRYFVCNLPAGIIFNIYTLWLIYALYLNLGIVLINF